MSKWLCGPVCWLGLNHESEAQILDPTPAWNQAGAGRALAPAGEHNTVVSCCLSVSPHHASIAHIALLPSSKISRLGKYTSRQAGQCSYRDTARLLGWSQASVCRRWNSQKVYASWPTPCLHFVEDASAQNHVFTKIGCKEISSNCIELSGEIWCLAIVLLE